MKKTEIQNEILSKIEIELDTLFYMPGRTIKGNIKINPELKLKNNKINLKLKLIQYEFWEYNNTQIDELKNIYKKELKVKFIEYELKEEERTDFNENLKVGNFSIILLEKEENDKFITIPFEFELDKDNKNLLPTFQYITKKYILGIRHLLIVECEEYNSMNYIGLFIGKERDNNFSEPKIINIKYKQGFVNADITFNFQKQTFYFGEDIDFDMNINSQFTFNGTMKFHQLICRKLEWKGYMKNTLIDKTIYEDKLRSYINEYGDRLYFSTKSLSFGVCGGIIGGISGSIIGGIICPNILLGMLSKGILSLFLGAIGGVGIAHISETRYKNTSMNFTFNNTSEEKNLNEKEIKKDLQKFVYFKENKIVGFIKFKNNITPPVDGYYFKCGFTLKVDIEETFTKNILKQNIDFYDGSEYINDMEKALNINSLL